MLVIIIMLVVFIILLVKISDEKRCLMKFGDVLVYIILINDLLFCVNERY